MVTPKTGGSISDDSAVVANSVVHVQKAARLGGVLPVIDMDVARCTIIVTR